VGFERVRRDAGIVAPHFGQKDIAGHDFFAGAIEILEYRRFFFGQADFGTLFGDQKLGCGLEAVAADVEYGVLAVIVLSQLSTNARKQDGLLEGLGDVVIGTGVEAEDHVGVGRVARQHDDGASEPALAQHLAGFAAVHVGQLDIEHDKIDLTGFGLLDALCRRGRRLNVEFVVEVQLLVQLFAQFIIVIDEQNGSHVAHGLYLPTRSSARTSAQQSVRRPCMWLSRGRRRRRCGLGKAQRTAYSNVPIKASMVSLRRQFGKRREGLSGSYCSICRRPQGAGRK